MLLRNFFCLIVIYYCFYLIGDCYFRDRFGVQDFICKWTKQMRLDSRGPKFIGSSSSSDLHFQSPLASIVRTANRFNKERVFEGFNIADLRSTYAGMFTVRAEIMTVEIVY